MASTYSNALRLEMMGTGDQSGTWGLTNNTNLGTLLEQAITGVLSVAQGDVANLTLTANNGASDQARNAVVELTGALTAARNVVVPTSNKLYLIKNSTSGGYALTVKTAAGTGVSVAAGTSRWVYCDGTNVVDGIVGTLASQVASAVAITGGTITGLTSLTLASGAATPATNDAAALGTSTLMWSDLFLASGAVVNWNNGDVTLTHAANALTFAGATNGYTFDANGAVVVNTDAANILALRNSTNAQAMRIYNTFTDTSNYERVDMQWTSNVFRIGTSNLGTGGQRNLELAAVGGASVLFRTNSTNRWEVDGDGHLWAVLDNAYDIGADGATRPRTGYFGTSVVIAGVPVYTNIPQNSKSADYTTVLADAQKHLYHPASDNNPRTFTIAANASVAYPIGTAITFVNRINTLTIAITSDTLRLAGTSSTGSRTLAANGLATAIKTDTTEWMISGAGLS